MLSYGRAKILFATVSRRSGRWFVSLNVEAAELHAGRQHDPDATGTWVGVDRGLHDLAVAAEPGPAGVAEPGSGPAAVG